MLELLGEFECKIDAKGRMRLPSALLKQLGEGTHTFVVNRGVEHCLTLYPKPVWDIISAKIKKLNSFVANNRKFIRYFFRGATELTPDASDRVLIAKNLLEYAGIEKDAVLFAINDRVEIWSKDAYFGDLEDEPENFSDLAESVMGGVNMDDLILPASHDTDNDNSNE